MTVVSKEIPGIMTLDFNWEINFVNGQKAGLAKSTLSHCLQTAKIPGINAEKATDWAVALEKDGQIVCDKSDFKSLKNWCISEENNYLIPITTRRFQEFFEKLELTQKEK